MLSMQDLLLLPKLPQSTDQFPQLVTSPVFVSSSSLSSLRREREEKLECAADENILLTYPTPNSLQDTAEYKHLHKSRMDSKGSDTAWDHTRHKNIREL